MNLYQRILPIYILLLAVLDITMAVLAYRDAKQRGRSGILVALPVLWTPPLGVLLWVFLRPPLLSELHRGKRSTDVDAEIKRRANEGRL
jgi:hypothetical protein